MAEKEIEHFKEQLSIVRNEQYNVDNSRISQEYEQRIQEADKRMASKEFEIQRLVKKVEKLTNEMDTKEFKLAAKIENLECQNKDYSQEINMLQSKLDMQQDYESIKRDLAILRSLEGDTNIDDISSHEVNSKKPVEVLILERSKALQAENTSLRMDKERLGKALDEITSDLASKCAEFEKQTILIRELETHVEKLQQFTNTSHRGEADGGRSSTDILKELDLVGQRGSAEQSSKTSSVVMIDDPEPLDIQSNVHVPASSNKDQDIVQQGSHMLPIVQVRLLVIYRVGGNATFRPRAGLISQRSSLELDA